MKTKTWTTVFVMFLGLNALADPNEQLMSILEDEIAATQQAFNQAETVIERHYPLSCTSNDTLQREMALSNFWLRFRVQVGFAIPPLVSILVVPEIEMLWQKTR